MRQQNQSQEDRQLQRNWWGMLTRALRAEYRFGVYRIAGCNADETERFIAGFRKNIAKAQNADDLKKYINNLGVNIYLRHLEKYLEEYGSEQVGFSVKGIGERTNKLYEVNTQDYVSAYRTNAINMVFKHEFKDPNFSLKSNDFMSMDDDLLQHVQEQSRQSEKHGHSSKKDSISKIVKPLQDFLARNKNQNFDKLKNLMQSEVRAERHCVVI